MKKLINLIPVLFLLSLFVGCSGKSGVPLLIYDQQKENVSQANDSFIVIGANLDEGDIKSYLYSLELDGQSVGMQGVYMEEGKQLATMHHHIEYYELPDSRSRYLIWKIPADMLKLNQPEALIYLASIGDNERALYVFDFFVDLPVFSRPMSTKVFPFLGETNPKGSTSNVPALATEEPPVLDFEGALIKVKPGMLYYLGDIKIDGAIKKVDDSNYVSFGVSSEIKDNQVNLRSALKMLRLDQYRAEDLSKSWQKYPISLYLTKTREPLKK